MKKYALSAAILFLTLILSPLISVYSLKKSSLFPAVKKSSAKTVSYTDESGTTEYPMEDFIFLSVARQMPATYCEEALKAQAVCVYSYALYMIRSQEEITQKKLPLATDEQLQLQWGEKYDTYCEKLHTLCAQVQGMTLTYNGEPAKALTHALNNGKTVASETIPYLQSVESPGDRLSPNYAEECPANAYGMSRYGADFMARQGFTCRQILQHYFPGTDIE